jgi:hypothetical protein
MTWTYSGDPSDSPQDTVRFLVGDTLSDEPLATDEEISWALSQNSNVYAAAAIIANSISTYLARLADTEEIGPIKVQYSNRVKAYDLKAKDLAMKASTTSNVLVYAGGISVSDKETNKLDADAVSPSFSIGQDDYLSIAEESGI